jgi:hypothetical protein
MSLESNQEYEALEWIFWDLFLALSLNSLFGIEISI